MTVKAGEKALQPKISEAFIAEETEKLTAGDVKLCVAWYTANYLG